ncbi:MAG: TonB-dependent receptor [Cytophagaceae bacterium]
MKRILQILLITLIYTAAGQSDSFAQTEPITISGKITDEKTGQPVSGVAVITKDSTSGATTAEDGTYSFETEQKPPFTILVSFPGYEPKEIEYTGPETPLNISLRSNGKVVSNGLPVDTSNVEGETVVYSVSRMPEKISKAPVAIEVIDQKTIKENPSPTFFDAMANQKGVIMTTSSLTFKVPNTRGFNSPNNFRFMQLVDGIDMQAAALGVPLGNTIGPNELDIESVEITPGAASALYGMNAINGMANMITKSPFKYQGLSFYQRGGINHVNDKFTINNKNYGNNLMSETAIRYAKAFNDKFAFKVNASYFQGIDWISNTTTDQNPQNLSTANPAFPQLSGSDNPAYDAWNKYGDESGNNLAISAFYQGKDQTFNVRRTGYWEKDLINPEVKNAKADAGLYYKLKDDLVLSYNYRYGLMDGLFQRGNKIRLNNYVVQNHKLELKGSNFLLRTYMSLENSGQSYNLKPLADNLDLTFKDNTKWSSDFQSSLQNDLNNGVDLATAMNNARSLADAGRPQPGSAQFEATKNTIIGINNWDHASIYPGAPATGGAALKLKTRLYHGDAQYDFADKVKFARILVGADYRVYQILPDGNNYVDFTLPPDQRNTPDGNPVYYSKYGAFVQATKLLLDEKLKLVTSLRIDQNLSYNPKFNPRVAAVYTAAKKHNFRVSYQNGYRFPSLFEALSYVNNGGVRRIGGLGGVNNGLGYLENSFTLSSVNDFNAAVNADVAAGYSRNQAALKEKGILQATDLKPTRPEQINSFEAGYKSVLLNNKLTVDLDGYFNIYDGFLGQVDVAVPTTGKVGSDEAATDMLSKTNQTRYRVYTNAKQTYHNYGSAIALSYNFYKKYTIGGNLNYNNISQNKNPDVFVTGFNTPKWSTNISFGNREIVKNLGFNVIWRYQNSFLWQSPLANGTVPSYYTFDAQLNYRMPELKSTIKIGGSNILNRKYIQYAAGPTIGALYYVSLTIDGLFENSKK